MAPDFPFDAVLFDLDGTLVATERFWPDAARAGAIEAFAELGIERELPTQVEWMGLVGLALEEGFDALFADLEPAQRRVIEARCVEAETRYLAGRRADLLPGVEAALEELTRRGVRMGIASNCHQSYLDAMLDGCGLARWIEEPRCLETPGIADKAAMVEDLLLTFGTRSAVMVGDRSPDRDAAWANGIPHVHLSRGYAALGEEVRCEAVIEGMDALVPRLERRRAWLDRTLAALDLPDSSEGPLSVGVSGSLAAGKTLYARDLARRVAGPAAVVPVDAFRGDGEPGTADDPFGTGWDVARLIDEVLEPHGRGQAVDCVAPAGRVQVPQGALLLLEGPFLAHPRLREQLDRLVRLEVSDEVCLRRVAGRDARLAGLAPLERAQEVWLPLEAELARRYPPGGARELSVRADNPLGPPE